MCECVCEGPEQSLAWSQLTKWSGNTIFITSEWQQDDRVFSPLVGELGLMTR